MKASSGTPPLAPEALRIRMLGGFSVSVGSRTIEDDEWRLKKAASLIKLLALAPRHRMHREQVMDLLWPSLDLKAAANNLRYTLYNARKSLEPALDTASGYLQLRGEQLVLCPKGELWVDVEAFEEAAGEACRSSEPTAYEAAIDLYAGDLLPEDLYKKWAEDRREQLQTTYLALLLKLAQLHEQREEYEPAIEALRGVLREEPTNEGAHVGLMRLYVLSGQRQEALGQYKQLREILLREIGSEPAATSHRLYEEILEGRSPATHALQQDRLQEEEPSATPHRQHNLPDTLTSFIGRERETLEVKRLLSMTRLLTLTGAGGSGKTRLALEVAKDLVGIYPDGVWLVELAELSDPALVPQEVADALKVREQPGRPILDTRVEVLREKKLLLVLDNCEHLRDAVAHLIEELLSSCAGLRILATSREPLGVTGEANWRVPSLRVPDAGGIPAVQNLARYEAVGLFVDRARSRRPTFVMTSQNAQAVAEVCRKLEGIPLAIELAAARVAVLSVEQIVRRLEGSIKLLTVGEGQMADPRHQTLRGALDWSYELLDEPERRLFKRLSVFAGGWTLEAAEAVGAGGGIEGEDVLDLLSELIDKSLVVAELGEGWNGAAAMRYRMLEPVRQYALEKLEESGGAEQTKHRHAEWCLTLAEEAEEESSGSGFQGWLDRLETEHDNLRAALRRSLDGGDAGLGLRLAGALWLFWWSRGHLGEGREWLETGVIRNGPGMERAKTKALKGAAWIAVFQNEHEVARALLEESLALSRESEDEEGIASSLVYLGLAAVLGDQDDVPVQAILEEALRLKPKLKDQRAVGDLLIFEGLVAASRGDLERGAALHEEGLELFRKMRDTHHVADCLINLGLIRLAQTNYERASTTLGEALSLAWELDHKVIIQLSLIGLAAVATSRDLPARAARLWGVAEGMHEAYGVHLSPVARSRTNYEGYLAAAHSWLDEATFEEAWAEGKAMTIEQAMEYALSEEEPAPPMPEEPPAEKPLGKLTQREQEIAELVAQGLTNRQISIELGISERTAGNHVARILRKLELRSRAQITRWMTERQILAADPD